MRGVYILLCGCTLAFGVPGCGGDDTTPAHDAAVDAPPDESGSPKLCQFVPLPGDELCADPDQFCCYTADLIFYCSAQMESNNCREQPKGGTLQSCDSATGAGCPTEKPICCAGTQEGDTSSYCTDHAYQGPYWTCSP